MVAPVHHYLGRCLNLLLFAAGSACSRSEQTGPVGPLASIDSFVAVQQLVHPSVPRTRLELAEQRVTFFDLSFGTPFPCDFEGQPVVCQLGYATGLRYGARIGWLAFDYFADPDSAAILRAPRFDLDPSDADILSLDFTAAICAHDYDLCHYTFPHYLARDIDTPRWRLLALANTLITFIDPVLAEQLLVNPTAGSDCKILQIIASLPVYQGDAYAGVRVTAATRSPAFPLAARPNKRLKLAGGDRSRGSSVVPWRAQTVVHYSCAGGHCARSLSAIR